MGMSSERILFIECVVRKQSYRGQTLFGHDKVMKSYLKFLSRNKLYTAIEAVGLAVSLAFVIIIGSYVWQQFSVTREHPDRERVYVPGTPGFPALTYGFPDAIGDIPEIESVSRMCNVVVHPTIRTQFPVCPR